MICPMTGIRDFRSGGSRELTRGTARTWSINPITIATPRLRGTMGGMAESLQSARPGTAPCQELLDVIASDREISHSTLKDSRSLLSGGNAAPPEYGRRRSDISVPSVKP